MERDQWILIFCLVLLTNTCSGSWGEPGSSQYHIQTDEGPERYFRFQTDNGQFRKEKRLQDGTVIGTDAWIDAAGYLRQNDYIADQKGYRILKSKIIFVGKGRPIEEAIKSIKDVPSQSGVLVDGSVRNSIAPSNTIRPIYAYSDSSSTTNPSLVHSGYLSPAEAAKIPPSPYLGYDHYPPSENAVHIRPHSQPLSGRQQNLPKSYYLPAPSSTQRSVPQSANSFEIPFESLKRVRPIGVISSTLIPIGKVSDSYQSSSSDSGKESYPTTTPSTHIFRGYSKYSKATQITTTPTPSYYSTSTGLTNEIYSDYDENSSTYGSSSTESSFVESSTLSRAVIPLDINGLLPPVIPHDYKAVGRRPAQQIEFPENTAIPYVQNNNLGSGYESAPPEYDGIATTKNGFRYILPTHYHEEEQIDSQKKAGSFSYIDPFGIRRAIYYNASPEQGFVHRKNNRYVGFSTSPYDPRPLETS